MKHEIAMRQFFLERLESRVQRIDLCHCARLRKAGTAPDLTLCQATLKLRLRPPS
jgi:hypothetical protein